METERNAYTRAEFFARNKIGKDRFYAEIAAGRLIARKSGKRVLISAADEAAWLASLPKLVTGRAGA
jgi:hypothetical protein